MRVLLFFNINFYIDSDQPFMWAGAKDYSQGLFYEPRFYGQNYNSFMESLFAVPLMWLKVPVYYALPIATHFISLFPFLFTAFYLFFAGKKESALLVLAILLCMTPAYDILNSLPRGFVTGVFFSSFFVLTFLHPKNIKYLVLNILLLELGYFINPNSIIISVPFLIYTFFNNYNNRKYYLVVISCLFFVYPLRLIFDQFYIDHPSYVIYGLEHSFSFEYFLQNITHPEQAFGHINFFAEEHYLFLFLTLLLLLVALFKRNRPAFYAFSGFLLVLVLSFFSGKTREGSFWPFYSYSRMYLGVPLVICLFAALLTFSRRNLIILVVPVTLLFSGYKFLNFKNHVAYHTMESHAIGVHLVRLETVLDAIKFYKDICEKNKADHLLISNTFWLNTYLDYGGPAVYGNFPGTEETRSERRYRVWKGNEKKIFSRFVLISVKSNFDKLTAEQNGFETQRLDDYGLFLIKNNTLTNDDFIALVNKIESGS